MQKKWIITIGMVGLLLMGGTVACKHGCHPGGFDKFDLDAVTGRIASKLDLTEDQKTKLDTMAAEIMEEAKARHADKAARLKELADVVRRDSIDKAAVDETIDQKMADMREMVDFVAERLIAFHGELTPEQREKIATRIEERADKGCAFGFR